MLKKPTLITLKIYFLKNIRSAIIVDTSIKEEFGIYIYVYLVKVSRNVL